MIIIVLPNSFRQDKSATAIQIDSVDKQLLSVVNICKRL